MEVKFVIPWQSVKINIAIYHVTIDCMLLNKCEASSEALTCTAAKNNIRPKTKVCLSHVLGRLCASIAEAARTGHSALSSLALSHGPMATCDDGCRKQRI